MNLPLSFLTVKENEGDLPGRKRAASKGRARGESNQVSKRGRKSDNSSIHKMFMNKEDDDDDDEDNVRKKLNKLPRVCIFYGFLISFLVSSQLHRAIMP